MRKSMRILALAMAVSLTVTSVPADLTLKASAAVTSVSSEKKATKASTSAAIWIPETLTEDGFLDEGEFVRTDNITLSDITEFKSKEVTNGKMAIPYLGDGGSEIYDYVSLNEEAVKETFGIEESVDITGITTFTYQWYSVAADGTETAIDGEEWLDYTPEKEKTTNLDEWAKWICKIQIDGVEADGEEYSFYDEDQLIGDEIANNELVVEFEKKYIGPTAKDFQNGTYTISDFFEGVESLRDQVLPYSNYDEAQTEQGADLGDAYSNIWRDTDFNGLSNEITKNFDYANCLVDYTWKAVAEDGEEAVIESSTQVSGVYDLYDLYSKYEFDSGKKTVAYYQVDADLYYGYIELGSVSQKYKVAYEPISVTPRTKEVRVRQNGKATFKVEEVEILDSNAVEGYNYQWYSVAKNGTEKKLDGEVTSVLKKKITEYDTIYVCRVTVELAEAYQEIGTVAVDSTFIPVSASGYYLKDASNRYTAAQLGEEVELFAKAKADNGYRVSYQWDHFYEEAEDPEAQNPTYVIKKEKVGNDSSIKVKLDSEEDFLTVDEDTDFSRYIDFNYRLTITVLKSGNTYATYYYYFTIEQYSTTPSLEVESNDGEITVLRGENVELYAKTEDIDGYTITKDWYKYITTMGVKKVTTNPGTENESVEYIYDDPEFVEPENVYKISDGTVEWNSGTNENGDYYESEYTQYTYYEILDYAKDKDTCLLSGKKNGQFYDDILGDYYVEVKLYPDGEEETPIDTVRREYSITYDSQLNAYVKNKIVQAAVGTSAKLEVVAGNINTQAYPITYQWTKLNEETGEYEELENETKATLTFQNVTKEDYGKYGVIIEDVCHGEELGIEEPITIEGISLVASATKYVEYTPTYSTFKKTVGDKVSLKAELELEDGITPFYAWYRTESAAGNTSYGSDEEGIYDYDYYDDEILNWEIINQDTNEYNFTILSEDDLNTQYRCEVSFLTEKDGEILSVTKTFYYNVKDTYYFDLERLSLSETKKKVGDSATYSVRLLTDDTRIDTSKVVYQWYRKDEEGNNVVIQGANTATYTIASLKEEDFSPLYVQASTADGKKATSVVSFRTSLYLETPAYLETNHDEVLVKKGSNATMQPVIMEGSGIDWSYQWYREEDDGTWTILHGETSAALLMNNVGDEEFRRYKCEIYYYSGNHRFDTYYVTLVKDSDTSHIRAEIAAGYEYSQLAVAGRSASFGVTAISSENLPLKYQWYFGKYSYSSKTAIGEAIQPTYNIAVVTPDNYGYYTCVVMDENGRRADVDFYLGQTAEVKVESEGYNTYDTIGYSTTLGGSVNLTATATCAQEYQIFYQWYRYNEDAGTYQTMYGENAAVLSLNGITKEQLGAYRCQVYSTIGGEQNLYYMVYVDTGLVVRPSTRNVLTQADGTVKMYVNASANSGEQITYQWSKWTEAEEEEAEWNDYAATPLPTLKVNGSSSDDEDNIPSYIVMEGADSSSSTSGSGSTGVGEYTAIAGATTNVFTLPKLTKADYGTYRCVVSTSGETYEYTFYLNANYTTKTEQVFLEQGGKLDINNTIQNAAVDSTYTYTWYMEDAATGDFRKITGDQALLSTTAPNITWSDNMYDVMNAGKNNGYINIDYKCVIRDTSKESNDGLGEKVATNTVTICLLPDVEYSTNLPETTHPNDETWHAKGYQVEGATGLKITFDEKMDLGNARFYVIDEKGQYKRYFESEMDLCRSGYTEEYAFTENSLYVEGSKAIFLMDQNNKGDSYGYKVTNIEAIGVKNPDGSNTSSGAAVKVLPKKGKKVTRKNVIYKVTKSHKTKGTVAVVGIKASKIKKIKKVTIANKIKINGYQFKVTAIAKNAIKGCKKLQEVTIGKNVKSIGANAFSGDKKLVKITLKATKLKSVGKKAFAKVPKKAVVEVPEKQKKAYKKLLKKAGLKGKVKAQSKAKAKQTKKSKKTKKNKKK